MVVYVIAQLYMLKDYMLAAHQIHKGLLAMMHTAPHTDTCSTVWICLIMNLYTSEYVSHNFLGICIIIYTRVTQYTGVFFGLNYPRQKESLRSHGVAGNTGKENTQSRRLGEPHWDTLYIRANMSSKCQRATVIDAVIECNQNEM